jgi:hypothetical protein
MFCRIAGTLKRAGELHERGAEAKPLCGKFAAQGMRAQTERISAADTPALPIDTLLRVSYISARKQPPNAPSRNGRGMYRAGRSGGKAGARCAFRRHRSADFKRKGEINISQMLNIGKELLQIYPSNSQKLEYSTNDGQSWHKRS